MAEEKKPSKKVILERYVKALEDGELTEEDLEKASGGTSPNQLHLDWHYDFKSRNPFGSTDK